MYSTDCRARQTLDVRAVEWGHTLRRMTPLLALIVVCSLAVRPPFETEAEVGDVGASPSASSLGSFLTMEPSSGRSGNPSSAGKMCIPAEDQQTHYNTEVLTHPIRSRCP